MENHWDIPTSADGHSLAQNFVAPIDQAEMVRVAAGEFIMGISQEELALVFKLGQREIPVFATEVPARKVFLTDYYIDRYPVTNYQYRQFIKDTRHRKPMLIEHGDWGQPMQPVVFVGWEDARAYARWAGKLLPTEAQWEKAARGDDGRWWAWGHKFFPNRCNSREFGLERTSAIGTFDQGVSPYGCYDMSGNVWEMCEGRWMDQYLPMRGGCFLGTDVFVRATCRWTPEDPVDGAHWLGFRCIKEVPSA